MAPVACVSRVLRGAKRYEILNHMKSGPVQLPLFQKFDCHSCGYCCRNLVVNVTPDEQAKIVADGWPERLPGQELFVAYRFRGRRLIRLAHRADGACVFLGDDGLCRLHKESGAQMKPLPCRMYPFVPTPGAESVRIDLRADCPSVAKNQGQSLSRHSGDIAGYVAETDTEPMRMPPEWTHGRRLTAEEFAALATTFSNVLTAETLTYRERLRSGARLLNLLYVARIDKVRDERFVELMQLLSKAVLEGATEDEPIPPLPKRAGRLFRQWLFLHAIADDPADLAVRGLAKLRRSWGRYRQSGQFAYGAGPVPPMRPEWPETTFEAVAAIEPVADEHLEPLCRSMRVKLDAHAFCGPGYFGVEALSGLTALWMLPALVGWFARMEAVKAGRSALDVDLLVEGLRCAHHTFGVSPVFARISEKLRLQGLGRPGIVSALLERYGP